MGDLRQRYVVVDDDEKEGTKKEEKKKRRSGLLKYYTSLETKIEEAKTAHPNIQCKKGCAGCCRQPFSVILAEAEYIVEKYPREVQRAIKQIKHYDHLSRQLEAEAPGNDTHYADGWWDKQLPCPLLVNNTCSVYEARPAPCRNYFVTTDPALCHTRQKQRVRMVVPVPPELQCQVMMQLQPRSGADAGWFWEMLLRAWEKRK